MNELFELFSNIDDNTTIKLEKKIYPVSLETGFHLYGYFFSNTAKYNENPDGERFCAIHIESRKNITIDGNGATIMLHGIMTPFIFRNCENITLKNITIDHYRPTMSELTFTDTAPGKATLRINEEFLYKIDNNVIYWHSENNENGNPYWEIPYKGPSVLTNLYNPETGIIDDMICGEGDSYHGFPDIETIDEISKGILKVTFRDKNKLLPEGSVAQTRCIKRIQTGGAFDDCKNVRLENIRIKSMNCFGILAQNTRDVTYKNLDLTPAEGRTIVSDADFFHFSGCSGKIHISHCKATGAHDDIINIHGTHLKIIEINREEHTAVLRYSHPESWGFNPYVPGDDVEFVCGNTLIPYHSAKVTAIEKINPTDFLVSFSSLPNKEPAENDVIENITRTAEMLVENNIFERIPSRAILCTTRKDVVIRNNTFRNMGAPALVVADDANFWYESGRSGTIVFENNKIENCSARENNIGNDIIRYEPVIMDKTSDKAVHDKLIVRNNHFINTLGNMYTFNLNYLNYAEFENNTSDCDFILKCNNIVKVTNPV